MEKPTRRSGEEETRLSAKQLCSGSIPLCASNMSVEHGISHGGETVTDIIGILFLSLLAFPYILETTKEAFETIAGFGGNSFGGHGH